jgi:peptidoglycan hydrolase FlgJ
MTPVASPISEGAALGGRSPEAQARRAAQEIESFVESQFVSSMFAGLETDPVFGGGPSEAIYRSLMAEEFGRAAARSGGFGIADSVYREMLQAQEDIKR